VKRSTKKLVVFALLAAFAGVAGLVAAASRRSRSRRDG
jgi:ABC-type branched-subunit amino acid transport system permease subunit